MAHGDLAIDAAAGLRHPAKKNAEEHTLIEYSIIRDKPPPFALSLSKGSKASTEPVLSQPKGSARTV
jgi:hypothetical protein